MNPHRAFALLYVVFLGANLLCDIPGGTNASSRYTLLAAMVEDRSFRIDRYAGLTGDWARTPDGHTYSNKAPGPALAAFPLYWLWDGLTVRWGEGDRQVRERRRESLKFVSLKLLSLCLQVLPLLWLVHWWRQRLVPVLGPWPVFFAAALVLLGNTSAVFMNVFFGHGFAAVLGLAAAAALHQRAFFRAGMALGWAVLSDYGAGLWLLPIVAYLLLWERRLSVWGRGLAGAALPATLWGLYHTLCFGGVLSLPMKYQNPEFLDSTHLPAQVWGVISLLPNPTAMAELLWGASRGVLWTNPWIPVVLLFGILGWRRLPPEGRRWLGVWYAALGLLLLMNAGFGAWHGGDAPGPRYLCVVFPMLAVYGAWVYRAQGPLGRRCLGACAGVSVLFHLLVFVTGKMGEPGQPLWPLYLETFGEPSGTWLLRLIALVLVGAGGWAALTRKPAALSP